jgi:hypothetical protein
MCLVVLVKTTYDVSSVVRTYAVAMQAGRFTRYTAESPAAAWYTFYLLHKNVAQGATFLCKRMESSALPEATFLSGSVTA